MRLIIALFTSLLLIGSAASGAPAEQKSAAQKADKRESAAPVTAEQKAGAAGKAAQAVAGQCQAKTPNGEPCTAKAAAGSKFCTQHSNTKEVATPSRKTIKK